MFSVPVFSFQSQFSAQSCHPERSRSITQETPHSNSTIFTSFSVSVLSPSFQPNLVILSEVEGSHQKLHKVIPQSLPIFSRSFQPNLVILSEVEGSHQKLHKVIPQSLPIFSLSFQPNIVILSEVEGSHQKLHILNP